MARRGITGIAVWGALVIVLVVSGSSAGLLGAEGGPRIAVVVFGALLSAVLVRFAGAELAVGASLGALSAALAPESLGLAVLVASAYAIGVALRGRRLLSANGLFAGGVVAGAALLSALARELTLQEWGWSTAVPVMALTAAAGAAVVFRVGAGTPDVRAAWPLRTAVTLSVGIAGAAIVAGRLALDVGYFTLGLLVAPVAVAAAAHRASAAILGVRADTIDVLVGAIEAKDPYTAGHSVRVSHLAQLIGRQLGFSAVALDHLGRAALLHDIGKLAVPGKLLNKPGRLTAEEYETVKTHNDVCVEILSHVDFLATVVPTASDRYGHYDRERASEEIEAREGRAVAVADAFDAMTSTRAYRRALPQQVALTELRDKAGSQFDPECVEALVAALAESGETFGAGHEAEAVRYEVAPPEVGVGSAGLGQLAS